MLLGPKSPVNIFTLNRRSVSNDDSDEYVSPDGGSDLEGDGSVE
jgi:hypothetical protein